LPVLGTEEKDRLLNDLLHAEIEQVHLGSKVKGLDLVVAEGSNSLFHETIEAVHGIDDKVVRAALLPRLLPRLVDGEHVAGLAEAKIAIAQLESDSDRAYAIGELLACVNNSERDELWEMVQALSSVVNQAQVVGAVADKLSGPKRSQIVENFEQEFIEATSTSLPLEPFASLAKYIDQKKLPSFFEKIHAAPIGLPRLEAMTAAVEAMDSSVRTEAAAETLESLRQRMAVDRAAFSSRSDYRHGSLVARISPYLPETSLETAMEFAQTLSELGERMLAVHSVADRVEALGCERVGVWLRAMRRCGEHSRDVALGDLGEFSSLMKQIGGTELLVASILAIENVTRWWP
jgi:hypothetical protein